jgi:hypothetical protein
VADNERTCTPPMIDGDPLARTPGRKPRPTVMPARLLAERDPASTPEAHCVVIGFVSASPLFDELFDSLGDRDAMAQAW